MGCLEPAWLRHARWLIMPIRYSTTSSTSLEKVMFAEIDSWFIMRSAWGVRQVELYTRFTKRTVTTLLLATIKSITWSNVILLLLLSLHNGGYIIILLAIACAMQLTVCGQYDLWTYDSTIPQSMIEARRYGRLIMVYISIFQVSFLIAYFFSLGTDAMLLLSINELVIHVCALGVSFCFFCSSLLEYVLCAQSMTPKEKLKCDYGRARRHFLDWFKPPEVWAVLFLVAWLKLILR
jgi:hypothetical protein